MNYIENFGLEMLMETEEDTMNLCRAVCSEGRIINGYYNRPYINCEFGKPQFIVRTRPNGEEKSLSISGLDTHMSGSTIWKIGITHSYKPNKDIDPLCRQVLAYNSEDGRGGVVINLVNADILPSFLEGDEITAQMIGFPIQINYYSDEDAYADSQDEMLNGRKMLLADGAMMPVGLFMDKKNKSREDECLTMIRGTVKSALVGIVKFGEQELENYIVVTINTQFGDLQIAHTADQVDESELELIKVDSVVNGIFALSGDVAIYEYEKGVIRDFDHNLALLRYTLQEGEAERLASVLSDDAEYVSEWDETIYHGKDEIIDRFNYVMENNTERPFFAHYATITSIDGGEEDLPYAVDDKCIVIAMETKDNLESICFMECDEEDRISKIVVTRNSRYHFKLDERKEYPDLYDFEPPEDFYEGIVVRSHFHGFLDNELAREEVEAKSHKAAYYEKSARVAVNCLKNNPQNDVHEAISKIFANLFIKAIETALYGTPQASRDLNYFEAYESDEKNELLKKRLNATYQLGEQYYKDFSSYRHGLQTEDGYEEDLISALVFVQQIGEIYAKTELKKIREVE